MSVLRAESQPEDGFLSQGGPFIFLPDIAGGKQFAQEMRLCYQCLLTSVLCPLSSRIARGIGRPL